MKYHIYNSDPQSARLASCAHRFFNLQPASPDLALNNKGGRLGTAGTQVQGVISVASQADWHP